MREHEAYVGNLKLAAKHSSFRFAGELRPGAVVGYTGKALRSMGARVGDAGCARFVVVACACDLCQLGRHICVERPNGRHLARAAVRVMSAGQHHLDEGTPDQTDSDAKAIGKGLQMAIKSGAKIERRQPIAKRWQDCRAFVRALRARKYLVEDRPVMSEGIYWYLYELWQDGLITGARAYKKHVAKHEKAKGASSHREGGRRDDAT